MPLTGVMDSRSSVDQEPDGAFAWKQNFEITPDGKLHQVNGFNRPFWISRSVDGVACPYKNWDFHNQGDDVLDEDLLPITLLFPSSANDGVRRLFAGTKTRFMRMDEATGEWTDISTGLGADGVDNKVSVRIRAAELQDTIVFTNGFDNVKYHELASDVSQDVDLTTFGEGGVAITDVECVIQYQGVIMLMNMKEGGVRIASRIRWSDLNDPTAFDLSVTSSITDYQDLDYGEEILNAAVMLGFLYIFTDKSIWRCNFSVDSNTNTATLNCQRVYSEPRNRSKCLAYPNTLVSTGADFYYAGSDAIYHYNPYLPEPERIEWIYKSSGVIFEDERYRIDKKSCKSPIAEYWPDKREIHFSWPLAEAVTTSNYVATCNDKPDQTYSSGINRSTLVINTQFSTCDFRDYGMTAMTNFRTDLYADGSCNQQNIFLGAYSTDFCLKQLGVGYVRETYNRTTEAWENKGYTPMLRGMFHFGRFDADKKISKFVIDGQAENNTSGTVFSLRIGTSFTVVNPNETVAGCGVVWKQLSDKPVKCLMNKSASAYASGVPFIRPNTNTNWDFLYRGRFLYYEITIKNANGTAATGGGVTLSRLEVKAIAT